MCYISMDVCVDMYVVPSLRRVMNGIGGGAFYLFCFEELWCELLEQCSSNRWGKHQSGFEVL